METSGFLERNDGERIAWRGVQGRGPAVVWLGGLRSDMAGGKATALAAWAERSGRAFLRFDYFGHGGSSGAFDQATVSRWRDDVLAVLDQLAEGPLILVGSSMGGWLACLAALARPERVRGLALVAPAVDMTERLLEAELDEDARAALDREDACLFPSQQGEPYRITREFLADGRQWSILPGPVKIEIPVRILQGMNDPQVPWRHAFTLAHAVETQDVVFTLVRDGDHSLSRAADLLRLIAAVEELCETDYSAATAGEP